MKKDLSYIHSKYYITSTTDLNGLITSVSEAFCKISGYDKSELIGKQHSIVRHPDTPKEVFKDLWETIKSGNTWSGIIKNKKKDGEFYWVDSTVEPVFNSSGEIQGYYSLRFDVTSQFELIQANKKIEESVIRLKKLFENVNSGIVILDKNGHIKDVNPYLYNLLGYSKEEFMAKSYLDYSNDADKVRIRNIIREIFKGNISEQRIEKESIKKDGSTIWLELTYSYFDENTLLLSINSIENLKKLEYTTNLLVLQSRDAAMGEMLAMIAHQWRQPLATLGTILSKIKIKRELNLYSNKDFDTDFFKLNSIIVHLSKTIEYFKNYFKPKKPIKEKIKNVLEEIKNIIEPLYTKNNIEMVFDNSFINDLKIDSRVDQVLLNIYKNAIESCFEKNKKGKIVTNISVKDNFLLIDISDDGGGISMEIIDKIFEPYYSTKSKNGTGLGLYMSKDIVENILGGKLSVKNIPSGACFTISLKLDNNGN